MRNFVQNTFSLSPVTSKLASNLINTERKISMKNIVKSILLLSLLLVFVGCGNTTPTPQEELDTQAFLALYTAKVIKGASWDLDKYKKPYTTVFPPGKNSSDVVGVAIAKSNNRVYVWYKDGTASSGNTVDLDKYRKLYNYSLPPGKTPSDIKGMGIAANDRVVTWYRDGTASKGTSWDLDRYKAPYAYSLPALYEPSEIVGMAIAPNNRVITWLYDGKAIKGTSWDLDKYKSPYNYTLTPLPANTCTWIRGMGVSSSARVYTIIKNPISCPPIG